jgi:hypothetical protein
MCENLIRTCGVFLSYAVTCKSAVSLAFLWWLIKQVNWSGNVTRILRVSGSNFGRYTGYADSNFSWFSSDIYCVHAVMWYTWWLDRQHNKYFKYKPTKCCYLHWLYLVTATCLGPYWGSLIKYISCYWNILIWIHVSTKSVIINNTSGIV